MKTTLSLLCLFTFLALAPASGMAQSKALTKKEKKKLEKEWKAKAKQYVKNPLALKSTTEANTSKVADLTKQIADLKSQLSDAQGEREKAVSQLNASQSELQQMQALKTAYEAQKNVNDRGVIPGLVFKVQIGAFQYFDMSKYLSQTDKNFEGESRDNLNKYTMGNFRDLAMAENFKRDIRKMGIRDAFIVPYVDGVRVTMAEAKKITDQGGPTPK